MVPSSNNNPILESIEKALKEINYPTVPVGLYDPIAYVLEEGGKRLRPTLLLLAYKLYRDDWEKALPAALGLETYHNHTLLHDDLMDSAEMRRGRLTVHRKWNDNTAILSGDAMLIMAFRHFLTSPLSSRREIISLFAQTAAEICEGQQYDVNFETRTDVSEAEYLEMIRLKTAVFLGCAVKLGAMMAEAPTEEADALYDFAEKMGLAFQIQDDYLDVYGDPKVFGKKIGGDILCGKKTFLLFNALNKADDQMRQDLCRLLAAPDIKPEEKNAAVTDIYNQLDIPVIAQKAIEEFYEAARRDLERISVSEERRETLWHYAQSLLGRKN